MSNETRRSGLVISMLQAGLLGIVLGLSGYLLLGVLFEMPARAQGSGPGPMAMQGPPPFGPGGFPGGEERKLVKQFDKDGDKWLNQAERKAAREFLASEPSRGFGRRGGFRGVSA